MFQLATVITAEHRCFRGATMLHPFSKRGFGKNFEPSCAVLIAWGMTTRPDGNATTDEVH